MGKKAFIGGPISHLLGERDFVESFVKNHILIIQMLQEAGYEVLSAHVVEDYGNKKIEPDEVIVGRDLKWINEADLCVFLLPVKSNEAVRTDGTYVELGYASAKCKNIICFWDSKNADYYSPMYRGMTIEKVKMFDINKIKEVLLNIE